MPRHKHRLQLVHLSDLKPEPRPVYKLHGERERQSEHVQPSLVVRTSRHYAPTGPRHAPTANEPQIPKAYTAIWPVLYKAAMCRRLPGVKAECTRA